MTVVVTALGAPATAGPEPATARGAAAGVGGGGTIVYVHHHNVWIAGPDGSRRAALTTDGTAAHPYSYPSEDDHGHVVAVRGNGFVILDQAGHVLNHYAQPLNNTGTMTYASVSPDGSKIGFSMYIKQYVCSPNGMGGTHCQFEEMHSFYVIRAATGRLVSTAKSAAEAVTGSWVSSSRVVVDDAGENVYHQELGANPVKWYADCEWVYKTCSDSPDSQYWHLFPTVNRQGNRYASVVVDLAYPPTDARITFLNLMDTAGFATRKHPASPTMRCTLQGRDTTAQGGSGFPASSEATIQTPTWSPDGRSIAAALKGADGSWQVWRFDIGSSLAGNCDPAGWGGGPILTDATQPRWSPARYAPPRHAPGWKHATHTRLKASQHRVGRHQKVKLSATVKPGGAKGWIRVRDGRHTVARPRLHHGHITVRLRLSHLGKHHLRAVYAGSKHDRGSTSKQVVVRVHR